MTGFAISIHLMAVIPALGLGMIILWRPKGTKFHKAAGRSWSGLVLIAVISCLGIYSDQQDPLYLVILIPAICLIIALNAIRRKNIKLHRVFMVISFTSLVITEVLFILANQLL